MIIRLSRKSVPFCYNFSSSVHRLSLVFPRYTSHVSDSESQSHSIKDESKKKPSLEGLEKQKLNSDTHNTKSESLKPWPDGENPHTGEQGGPAGPEPTRYGDWERKGRVTDF